jgi:hypothetical protein
MIAPKTRPRISPSVDLLLLLLLLSGFEIGTEFCMPDGLIVGSVIRDGGFPLLDASGAVVVSLDDGAEAVTNRTAVFVEVVSEDDVDDKVFGATVADGMELIWFMILP